jgi:hypothetical protein
MQICSIKGKPAVFSAFYCIFADVDSRAVNAICHCIMYIYMYKGEGVRGEGLF